MFLLQVQYIGRVFLPRARAHLVIIFENLSLKSGKTFFGERGGWIICALASLTSRVADKVCSSLSRNSVLSLVSFLEFN